MATRNIRNMSTNSNPNGMISTPTSVGNSCFADTTKAGQLFDDGTASPNVHDITPPSSNIPLRRDRAFQTPSDFIASPPSAWKTSWASPVAYPTSEDGRSSGYETHSHGYYFHPHFPPPPPPFPPYYLHHNYCRCGGTTRQSYAWSSECHSNSKSPRGMHPSWLNDREMSASENVLSKSAILGDSHHRKRHLEDEDVDQNRKRLFFTSLDRSVQAHPRGGMGTIKMDAIDGSGRPEDMEIEVTANTSTNEGVEEGKKNSKHVWYKPIHDSKGTMCYTTKEMAEDAMKETLVTNGSLLRAQGTKLSAKGRVGKQWYYSCKHTGCPLLVRIRETEGQAHWTTLAKNLAWYVVETSTSHKDGEPRNKHNH